jgi:hypothetical protein
MKRAIFFLLVWAVAGSVVSAQEQAANERPSSVRSKIYKLEELNWPQIDALERERTFAGQMAWAATVAGRLAIKGNTVSAKIVGTVNRGLEISDI